MSAEVDRWVRQLPPAEGADVYRALQELEKHGNELRMPLSRHLKGGLLELRFQYGDKQGRVTYTIDLGKRIITLTAFRKQRQAESREIARARKALAAYRQSRRLR